MTTCPQMSLLIVPVGGRWLKGTIGTVTMVLILLLKTQHSVVLDRLPSFFIHPQTFPLLKKSFNEVLEPVRKPFYV